MEKVTRYGTCKTADTLAVSPTGQQGKGKQVRHRHPQAHLASKSPSIRATDSRQYQERAPFTVSCAKNMEPRPRRAPRAPSATVVPESLLLLASRTSRLQRAAMVGSREPFRLALAFRVLHSLLRTAKSVNVRCRPWRRGDAKEPRTTLDTRYTR